MRVGVLVTLAAGLIIGCNDSPPKPASTKAGKTPAPDNRAAVNSRVPRLPSPPAATSTPAERPAPGEPPDLSYLPDDAFAILVFNTRRALASKALVALASDELFGSSAQTWNFDPRDVEQLLLFITPPVEGEPLGTPYSPGAVLRFAEAVDGPATIVKRAGEVTERRLNGKTYYTQIAQPATAFFLADDRTIVFAAEKQLEKMLTPTHVKNPLGNRLRAAGGDFDAYLAVNVEPLTPALDAVTEAAAQQLPAEAMPYVKALRDVSVITATADLSGERLLTLAIEARDHAAAGRLHRLAKESGPVIQSAYAHFRAGLLRAWIEDAAQSVLDVTDQLMREAVVAYQPDAIRIELAKPAQLDELGRRLRTALDRQPVRR